MSRKKTDSLTELCKEISREVSREISRSMIADHIEHYHEKNNESPLLKRHNHGCRWTQEEKLQLKREIEHIAKLHGRTFISIVSKVEQMYE